MNRFKLRKHLNFNTKEEIAAFVADDPLVKEMGNFVSQTKPQMVDGSCSGPCISYYIAAIVEALLHFCTTRQERLSEDYGDWVYELIKLYELAAFQLNRDAGPWSELAEIFKSAEDAKQARVMRAELAKAAGMDQDQIRDVKAYAWTIWIKIFEHHQIFQKVPHNIQLKMKNVLDGHTKNKKTIALRLAPVMLRANRLTCLYGWNYECFMWNCRNNCRPQMVGVRVAVNEGSNDKASFRKSVRQEGMITLVINEFFHPGKYRSRIYDQMCKESVLQQAEMIFDK